MDLLISWLLDYKYLAMFGILVLCGVGLPVPEEVTLVGTGLLVGWGRAEFALSSLSCILGILVGDSIIFGLGHHYGRQFLLSRPMRLLLSPRRQVKVARFFARHGRKAVFLARVFPGVRIGVYAYAGSQRMSWVRFLFLDFVGALITVPASIFVASWVAGRLADNPEEGRDRALEIVSRFGHWLLAGAVAVVLVLLIRHYLQRRKPPGTGAPPRRPPVSGPADGPPATDSRSQMSPGGRAAHHS